MEKMGTNMTQADYAALERSYTNELADFEAAMLINKWYGFEASRIEVHTCAIVADYEEVEISPGQKVHRAARLYSRKALWAASESNYIRFNVCGNQYELVNGELCFYID